jgi:hypothetical protein
LKGATTTDAILQKNIGNEFKKEIEITGPITLESHVREYFKDDPILAEIAKCESQFRHIGNSGKVIRGKVNKADVGVMQINEKYHLDQAEKLGYDLHTLEGNMAYAKWLYEKQGPQPWYPSEKCWGKAMNTENQKELAKS